MLFKSLFLILSHGFCPACPPEKVLVIDTGLARLNFAHLAHSLLLTRALGQRVLLDTQLLQHLAVVPHTVLALLFNLLLALNQQDQLVFKPAVLGIALILHAYTPQAPRVALDLVDVGLDGSRGERPLLELPWLE